jgi:hypothetical protein
LCDYCAALHTREEIAEAIRHEITVREIELGRSRDRNEGIAALRWCLEMVEDV